jgi:hypothetical protein
MGMIATADERTPRIGYECKRADEMETAIDADSAFERVA